ncbi:EsaB/YukD family protein [Paenibacillus sp. TRM 82003]|nr:EsaB/YukD family protein [Paenibacillus sp. TRM 82003]
MDYVLVTFQAGGREADLKVPTFVSAEELLEMLGEALQIPVGRENRLQAEPLGRILDRRRTLEEEGVGDGSLLTLL